MDDTWGTALDAWRDYLRATGSPATTVSQRLYHMHHAARSLGGRPGSVTFDALSAWLATQDWKPNTRRSYRSTLRAFYGWALAMGRVASSPAHLLPPVRVPRGMPRPAPESAFRAALDCADERVRLAVALAGRCGLRRSEIARIHADDLGPDLAGWSLRVTGKGGHVRPVPLPDDLAVVLRARSGWVFPSPQGGHLTPAHLGKLVSRALPGGLTTHTLRHRCATVSYAATRDLRAVQELLGHAKPETTALYTAVPDGAVRAAMQAAAA